MTLPTERLRAQKRVWDVLTMVVQGRQTLSPEDARALLRHYPGPVELDIAEERRFMADALLDENARLRAAIRKQHEQLCAHNVPGRHAPECMLYEIEP